MMNLPDNDLPLCLCNGEHYQMKWLHDMADTGLALGPGYRRNKWASILTFLWLDLLAYYLEVGLIQV